MRMRAISILVSVALGIVAAGCGGPSSPGEAGGPDRELRSLYCAYESQRRAEVQMCIRLITARQIIASTTPAARFAKSFGSRPCGPGSGPLCATEKRRAEAGLP